MGCVKQILVEMWKFGAHGEVKCSFSSGEPLQCLGNIVVGCCWMVIICPVANKIFSQCKSF